MGTLAAVRLTDAEAAVLEHSRALLARAEALLDSAEAGTFGEDPHGYGRKALVMACQGLEEARDYHRDLREGTAHPAEWFADLADHRDDALAVALERVTQDITAWAGAVVLVLAEHCAPEVAETVRGAA